MNKKVLTLLTTGHLVNDLHQGALPALLPFLIFAHNLSYSAAAFLVFAFSGTATIIQPLFGYLSDKLLKTWIMPLGIALNGSGFAMICLAESYSLLIVSVIVSGIGSAMFHPEAAKMVNYAGGQNKATAMSVFGVGGTLGFSIGPLIITIAVLSLGLQGAMITLLPVVITIYLFTRQLDVLKTLNVNGKTVSSPKQTDSVANLWLPFVILTITIIGKSVIYYSLFTFIPVYWTTTLNQSTLAGGMALTLFSAAGVIGNLAGGQLADKLGNKFVIMMGCILLIPALPLLLWTNNILFAYVMLFVVGALLLSTYAPTIVLGQKFLPNHIGFSSGITLGVAFSIGGMVTPSLGYYADLHGLPAALSFVAIIPMALVCFAYTLPTNNGKAMIQSDVASS
ncbi:MFS transporter [Vibrio sp. FNV 38]|nr:MFS transporter [Vibrio sp. FNV 38]